MNNFIEVPIVCNNEQTSALREVGVEIDPESFDIRIGSINVDHIDGFYPDANGKETIVEMTGDSFTVAMPYAKFKALFL